MSYTKYVAHPHTFHQFYQHMESTFLARNLLAAYQELERLYWRRMMYWFVWWMNKKMKEKYRRLDVDCINQRYRIQDLGGRVPNFWSLS